MLEKHDSHPLAVYAKLVKGTNEAREFKTIAPENKVKVRPVKQEGVDLLVGVVKASEAGTGIDNITLNQTMQRLVSAQVAINDDKGAAATSQWIVEVFKKRIQRADILNMITAQAESLAPTLRARRGA